MEIIFDESQKLETVLCFHESFNDLFNSEKLPAVSSQLILLNPKDLAYHKVKMYCCWLPRGYCEQDVTFKQVIPYVTIKSGDEVLCYTRGKSTGESRLTGKVAVGLGGHIDINDYPEMNSLSNEVNDTLFFANSLFRELTEEVGLVLNGKQKKDFLELTSFKAIVSNESFVDRVHLGISCVCEIPKEIFNELLLSSSKEVAKSEAATTDIVSSLRWENIRNLLSNNNSGYQLESWSRFVLKDLLESNQHNIFDDEGNAIAVLGSEEDFVIE